MSNNTRNHLKTSLTEGLDDEPLLRMLVAEAARRGDTLNSLAKHLGVTYSRLAQWRRKQATIANAQRSVHIQAAAYLGLPPVLAFVLAGVVTLPDFIWPAPESLDSRLRQEIEAMRQDPLLGGFVPQELASASRTVLMFVAFLYSELHRRPGAHYRGQQWLSMLHEAMNSHDGILRAAEAPKSSPSTSRGIF
ncbi:hypothetical protein [Polaromonas sp. SM01]|uniref:hypothetical protein n=1 Tax=Polaromonas sp. SM01 TaxID=3085630 RepID=UPI0029817C4A|nr:hypothetical protein [Polaromonas sp. SM01]MDW5443799.1 hypothetical protein [Polaromonas sp. SM01]